MQIPNGVIPYPGYEPKVCPFPGMDTDSKEYKDIIKFGLSYDKNDLIKSFKGKVKITHGLYDYKIFNICALNDILSQILMLLYMGYLPIVELNDNSECSFKWTDYFEQPYYEYPPELIDSIPLIKLPERITRIPTRWGPMYCHVFMQEDFELTCKLYSDWVVIREDVASYIANEFESLSLYEGDVLGVLCRGTDFTHNRPSQHPIQPEIDMVISDAKKALEDFNLSRIYLATEDGQIDKIFREAFGEEAILINKRHYLNEEFYSLASDKDSFFIGDMYSTDRDHQRIYTNGLEYLSSLILLASCNSLIAGICGGSMAAAFINGGAYEYCKLYDLGYYE